MVKAPLLQIFSENMRALRGARGLTQTQVARRAGISVAYVSMLEHALRAPPIDLLERIARALRVEPHELLKYKSQKRFDAVP